MHKHLKRIAAVAALVMMATPALAALTYTAAVKTARQQAVITAIDAGGAAGKLEIGTTSMATTLCTVALNYNPAGTAATGVLTLSGFPKTCTAGANGTAAAARIRTSANVDVITGLTVTATGGGGDITIDNPALVSTQTVTVSAFSVTHTASLYDHIYASASYWEAWSHGYL
jgi:hypothetical protein